MDIFVGHKTRTMLSMIFLAYSYPPNIMFLTEDSFVLDIPKIKHRNTKNLQSFNSWSMTDPFTFLSIFFNLLALVCWIYRTLCSLYYTIWHFFLTTSSNSFNEVSSAFLGLLQLNPYHWSSHVKDNMFIKISMDSLALAGGRRIKAYTVLFSNWVLYFI